MRGVTDGRLGLLVRFERRKLSEASGASIGVAPGTLCKY